MPVAQCSAYAANAASAIVAMDQPRPQLGIGDELLRRVADHLLDDGAHVLEPAAIGDVRILDVDIDGRGHVLDERAVAGIGVGALHPGKLELGGLVARHVQEPPAMAHRGDLADAGGDDDPEPRTWSGLMPPASKTLVASNAMAATMASTGSDRSRSSTAARLRGGASSFERAAWFLGVGRITASASAGARVDATDDTGAAGTACASIRAAWTSIPPTLWVPRAADHDRLALLAPAGWRKVRWGPGPAGR